MSVQLALGAVGGVVGFFVGGPAGAQWGFALGSLAGALAAPPEKIQGFKLDDLRAPRLEYGQAIPRLYGTQRLSGTPIWSSDLQPHETTEGGKGGGPEITNTTYTVDILFLVSIDSPIVGISRIWVNKALKYSVGPGSEPSDRSASENAAPWADIDVMDGNAAQTPWAEYEAAVGIGNAPAYRHRSTIGIAQLVCPNGQIPLVEFEVFTSGTATVRGYSDDFPLGVSDFTGDVLGYFTGGSHQYGGVIQVLAQAPGAGSHEITKTIPTTTAYGWRIKFHMTAQSDDDSGSFALRNFGTQRFYVVPRREVTIDALQRCHAGVDGVDIVLSSGPLDMFTWYELQVDLVPGSGNSFARLYNLDTGTLISTTFWTSSDFTSVEVNNERVSSEAALGTGDTLFSQLEIVGLPASYSPVDLRDIVEAEWARVADPAKLDASALDGIEVAGYATTQSARATFEELARIYYFGAYCDDQLHIVLRGGSSAATLTYAETGAGVDEAADPFCGMDRADELALPAFFSLAHPDATRDYDTGSVMSDRLITQSKETQQIQTSVVLTPTEAKGRADSYARDAYAASQVWQATVGVAHIARTPTDVITLTDSDGRTYRSRIERMRFADFVFGFEGALDDVNALSDEGIAPADGEPTITVVPPGTTVLELIDGHILRDDDDDAGLYGAVRINGTGTGSRVFKSIDGSSFASVGDVFTQAVMGVASTALGDVANPYVWDEVNTVTVSVSGTLSSSTRDAMQADPSINLFALKSGDGWEYFRARTASLLSANHYLLSGLIRGVRGTEPFMDGHVVGDTFVVLSTSGMIRIPGSSAEIGLERFYRGVTLGASSQASIPFTNEAAGLKPFSPTRLTAERDSAGDITISWSRRTRYGVRYGGSGGTLAPLAESSEAYQVDIYDGVDVVRTLSSTSESVVYTAAQQTTDFGGAVAAGDLDAEVFQISAAIGRGYGHRATV